ncbi:hypothetical protein MRB53_039091 [Persea americana]|nr:hypothetical protein MRB53_039091 [Persea americana]
MFTSRDRTTGGQSGSRSCMIAACCSRQPPGRIECNSVSDFLLQDCSTQQDKGKDRPFNPGLARGPQCSPRAFQMQGSRVQERGWGIVVGVGMKVWSDVANTVRIR